MLLIFTADLMSIIHLSPILTYIHFKGMYYKAEKKNSEANTGREIENETEITRP